MSNSNTFVTDPQVNIHERTTAALGYPLARALSNAGVQNRLHC